MTRALLIAALAWLGLQVSIIVLVGIRPAWAHNVLALGLTHALVLASAIAMATRPQERSAIVGGFSFGNLGFGLVLGVCLKLPADGIRSIVEHFHRTDPAQLEQQLEFLRHDHWWQVLLLFVVIAGTGPVMEEAFYRGLIFRTLRRVGSLRSAIVVSTLLFVTAHPSFSDWPSLLLVGAVLGALRGNDGNIWSAVGAHAAFNGATVLAVVVGIQGIEAEASFPVGVALVSAGLAAALLTFRFRQT